jgi:ribosomal protein S18 acetylase RimI-like enzyme
MNKFRIRGLEPEDWQFYKRVRLSSLKDSPDSFGATYEEELLLTDSEWLSRLHPNLDEAISLPLGVEVDGYVVGLAWGLIHNSDLKVAHIYQMWVSPEARGKGIATTLLDEIRTWALSEKCLSIELSVTASNSTAVGLYHAYGFSPAGKLEELRAGSGLFVQPMVMELSNAV